eukprot:Nitzschia sp. Nitz4//scaffold41_size133979//50447//51449//NITZ4_003342-RA/size133979-snap-gene-0.120-mRNA-1//-1//CDS//3329551455//9448//frame0
MANIPPPPGSSFLTSIARASSQALGREVYFEPDMRGGLAGGGNAETVKLMDAATDDEYFLKWCHGNYDMLHAELEGVKAIAAVDPKLVPTPICCGTHERSGRSFALFEFIDFCQEKQGSQRQLGIQLAKLHRATSDQGFGFHLNNTIGKTPQPNQPWNKNWAEFWIENRLGHMLKLTDNLGLDQETIDKLVSRTRTLLSHKPKPSLLHGDLWGGNKGFRQGNEGRVQPVIYDPATYYGDRETDIGMTYLFGGFDKGFYEGYESIWELPAGHEKRRVAYNLYHIMNHYYLFGGSYGDEARRMVDEILNG